MAKKTLVRKLNRVGKYSYSITIPAGLVKKFGWRERQKLSIEVKPRNRIEVRDWKRQ